MKTMVISALVSLITAIIVVYFKDINFKLRLEARQRYLKHLEERLTELYQPLYVRFAPFFKYAQNIFFLTILMDPGTVISSSKKEATLWLIQHYDPDFSKAFSDLERIVDKKTYLLSKEAYEKYVYLMGVQLSIEKGAHYYKESNVSYVNENGTKIKTREEKERYLNEQKGKEREKWQIDALSDFMDVIFNDYEQIKKEYFGEIDWFSKFGRKRLGIFAKQHP